MDDFVIGIAIGVVFCLIISIVVISSSNCNFVHKNKLIRKVPIEINGAFCQYSAVRRF